MQVHEWPCHFQTSKLPTKAVGKTKRSKAFKSVHHTCFLAKAGLETPPRGPRGAGGTRTFIESELPMIVRGGRQVLAR
eukprot:scaffold82230_cov73-Phaeocystis_antarctica.AAC.7